MFFLIHRGVLPAPLLYISSYLEDHRREYYERLQAVRERAEIQEWLQFFLTAVAVQAEDAVARAEHLHDLRERIGRNSPAPEAVPVRWSIFCPSTPSLPYDESRARSVSRDREQRTSLSSLRHGVGWR